MDKDIDLIEEFNKCRFRRELYTAERVNSLYCIKYKSFWLEILDMEDIKEEKQHFETLKAHLQNN